jgi:hypothetical protein
MPELTVFHQRFGGPISLEQELTDMTGEFPIWARPLWKLVLVFILPFIRKVKIERTLRQIDEQAAKLDAEWAREERDLGVAIAMEQARIKHPDAHIERVSMPNHPTDAVYIEHPPEPGNKAQELLGFGSIEIHAPFDYE